MEQELNVAASPHPPPSLTSPFIVHIHYTADALLLPRITQPPVLCKSSQGLQRATRDASTPQFPN